MGRAAGSRWSGSAGPPSLARSPLARTRGSGRPTPAALAAGTAAQAALPPGTFPLERLQVIVPALAAADPLRLQFDPPAVAAAGRAIIAGLVDCLPLAGAGNQQAAAGTGAGAGRGRHRPADRDPGPALAQALPGRPAARPAGRPAGRAGPARRPRAAASTLAARVAASVRADPYAVAATGLGAVGGALHGGASLGAETMLAAAQDAAGVPRVWGTCCGAVSGCPASATSCTAAATRGPVSCRPWSERGPASPRLAVVDSVLAEMHRGALPEPNSTLRRPRGPVARDDPVSR